MESFSIIMPFYNAENFIAEALQSIKKQSFTQWELIAVNDGSTDDSGSIFKTETKAWENVVLIEQENKGLGNARNEAAKKAKNNWLVFLDADDYWSGNKLEALAKMITSNPKVELLYHSVFELNTNGKMRQRKFTPIITLEEFVQQGNPLVPSALAIKKDVFLSQGGFIEDRSQVEDLLLWFRLLRQKINIAYIQKPLTVYRMGSGVTSSLEDHLNKVFTAIDQAAREGLISTAQVGQIKSRKFYEAARQLHKTGEFREALLYYEKEREPNTKSRFLATLCKLKIAL